MSVATGYTRQLQRNTGLDYSPVVPVMEQLVAATNPNDNSQVARLIQNLYDIADQHEAGQQLAIRFPRPAR